MVAYNNKIFSKQSKYFYLTSDQLQTAVPLQLGRTLSEIRAMNRGIVQCSVRD